MLSSTIIAAGETCTLVLNVRLATEMRREARKSL